MSTWSGSSFPQHNDRCKAITLTSSSTSSSTSHTSSTAVRLYMADPTYFSYQIYEDVLGFTEYGTPIWHADQGQRPPIRIGDVGYFEYVPHNHSQLLLYLIFSVRAI